MKLNEMKIAILATHGFEESELHEPLQALRSAGATVHVVSPEKGKIRGWKHTDWGKEVAVDVNLDEAKPQDYDALVLPGGVINPDQLRVNDKAIDFIQSFFDEGHKRPVAAICHGPWSLINARVVRNKKLTSYASIKEDLENAGAIWVDEEVVHDDGLVTSRKPDDLPAFIRTFIGVCESGTSNVS